MTVASALNLHELYTGCDGIDERKASAVTAAWTILNASGLTLKHRRELLGIAIWKYTEAPGCPPYMKYRIRYRSREVTRRGCAAHVNHEHVYPKKWIIDRLLGRDVGDWTHDSLSSFLEDYAVACIVTVAEHQRLNGTKSPGWQRYIDAGIDVLDMTTEQSFDLGAAVQSRAERVVRAEPLAEDLLHEEEDAPAAVDPAATTLPLDVVAALVAQHAGPAVHDFLRLAMAEDTRVVVARKVNGDLSTYVRVHDATLCEPTPTAAFVHYSGNIHYRLAAADVPTHLQGRVSILTSSGYGVGFSVGGGDVDAALGLLYSALERLREA